MENQSISQGYRHWALCIESASGEREGVDFSPLRKSPGPTTRGVGGGMNAGGERDPYPGTRTCQRKGTGQLRWLQCLLYFPGGRVVKNLPAHAGDARDAGSTHTLRKSPWRRKWQPTPVFLPGESHGQRSQVGYSPRVTKSQTPLSTHTQCLLFRTQAGHIRPVGVEFSNAL